MNKLFIIGVLGLMLVSGVYAHVTWSNPMHNSDTHFEKPIKEPCKRIEWNNNFEDYRAGILSKNEMINYIRSCEW